MLLAADRKIGEMRSAFLAAGTDAKWGTLEVGVWVVWWKREEGKDAIVVPSASESESNWWCPTDDGCLEN